MPALIEQNFSQIYLAFSVNSFIVFMDQLIELSKSKELQRDNLEDIEFNNQEIRNISSINTSSLVLLTELVVLMYLKNLLIFCIISMLIIFTIFTLKHSRIKKTKIFKINHIIFDILLIFKIFMLSITIKFLIK